LAALYAVTGVDGAIAAQKPQTLLVLTSTLSVLLINSGKKARVQ
jgi:hypothetical protein